MSVAETARRLVEHRSGHPVISLYLDLDPERFATAPARSSQITSLIDQAARDVEEHRDEYNHEDLTSLRADLDRVRHYLLSDEPPFQGAGSLAVFCSGPADLFETVQLPRPVEGRVLIEQTPFVEPLMEAAHQRTWCVVLVNRRVARVLTGPPDRLVERQEEEDNVHGEHSQGGWSQARYERSVEKDVDDHLRHAAEIVDLRSRRHRFDRVAVGGPEEIVPRFEAMLPEAIRAVALAERVEVDVASAGVDDVERALAGLVEADDRRTEREALDRLAAGIGGGGRAAGGVEPTLAALNERRVEKLLLAPEFDRPGARCPSCGLLMASAEIGCPVDGSQPEPIEHLREAVVEAALLQDAEVIVVAHHPDLGPFQGIAAVLRF